MKPLDDTSFQPPFMKYDRILATCIEKPEINWGNTPPWTTCKPVQADGHTTRTCDLDFNLGRLEDVCVKYGCMENAPQAMTEDPPV